MRACQLKAAPCFTSNVRPDHSVLLSLAGMRAEAGLQVSVCQKERSGSASLPSLTAPDEAVAIDCLTPVTESATAIALSTRMHTRF
jgi:hypothetical protein